MATVEKAFCGRFLLLLLSTFRRLLAYIIDTDLRFRYQCELPLDREAPSIATLSGVFADLTKKDLVKQLFDDLVERCRQDGIIDGSHVAIDSAAIHAYEKKQPKKKSKQTGNVNWGAKFDSFGNKMTWFGYKLHLAVDTKSELPLALEVTPAHVNDGDMTPSLIENVAAKTSVRFFMLDADYDQMKVYEAARNVKEQSIIPLNPQGEKEPPAGMKTNGTPCCSMGFAMTYWGADGDYLKFRCPHATGKVDCPLGMSACSSSNYDMVVKVDAKRWKELYNERTSVERCNSRMKTYLTADDMHVWGIQKVKTHQYLNAIVLLVSALSTACKKNETAI